MTPTSRLPVVLLWHMHQPQYRDALTGQYVLPWTYLHAIKDYIDMAAHLEAQPTARAVVNFTPVLIEQLEELSQKISAHLKANEALPDAVLGLLSSVPVPTNPPERLELMKACLRAQRKNLIERFGPYLELATIAETLATPERVMYASDQLIHDLAVWYHLAWVGETVRRADARVAALTAQGRAFTEQQRRELLTLVGELVASVVPRFRKLSDSGQCELSVTPYGHPIVPLLLDFQSAREAVPGMALPHAPRYPGGAERAVWHINEGLRVFTAAFGVTPVGCWPSEGAVSDGTLGLLEKAGFKWVASSANVLGASLRVAGAADNDDPSAYNRPYALPGSSLQCYFRDDTLSDRIGFNYSTWHGDDAAQNFAHELAQRARDYNGAQGHVILIALDGENAWEYYPFNGYYFLHALYEALANHPQLELTTLADCVRRDLKPAPLKKLVTGSWVHGTLATWMGDTAKNAAWDLLVDAKVAFDRVMREGKLNEQERVAAERQLALCESSDWFWWFGDYNPAEAVSQFDRLYRRQLVTLYRLLGVGVPEILGHPISVGRGVPEAGGVMRRATAS
jgi:alpha-amylase/alpha-mannosidase (GH57 family)